MGTWNATSLLSIFRTFQTKVQTSNVGIVIVLQLLIKLKSLMLLNFSDGYKAMTQLIGAGTVGKVANVYKQITGEERTLILIQQVSGLRNYPVVQIDIYKHFIVPIQFTRH